MKAIKSLFIKIFVCLYSISLVNGVLMTKTMAAAKISTAVNWAVAVANDDRNGYSQSKRNKSNKLGGVEYDCSALVYSACRAAGFSVSMGCTATMKSDFAKAGFTYISNLNLSNSSQLQTGDILWRSGHTEIYIGSNKLCGAHLDYDGKVGDSSGKEINVKTYYDNKWSGIFRYGSASTSSTKTATATAASKTTTTSTNYNFSTGTYKTTGDVNMRSAANTSSSVLKVVSKGTKFTVTSVSGRFGKTTISGKTGYVSLLYADLVSAAKTTATAVKSTATTSSSSSNSSSSSSSSESKPSKYSTGYYKLNDEMNLRTGPSTKYKLLVAIAPGTKVYVTEVSGNWGKITYKSKTGYIALTYSSKTTKYSTGTWKTTKKTYLRKSKSTSSKSLKTIKKGVKVKVKQVSGNWGKVTYSGKTGWVYLPSTNAK